MTETKGAVFDLSKSLDAALVLPPGASSLRFTNGMSTGCYIEATCWKDRLSLSRLFFRVAWHFLINGRAQWMIRANGPKREVSD